MPATPAAFVYGWSICQTRRARCSVGRKIKPDDPRRGEIGIRTTWWGGIYSAGNQNFTVGEQRCGAMKAARAKITGRRERARRLRNRNNGQQQWKDRTSFLVNYRTAIVTFDWLLDSASPTKIATGTALPGLRPRGIGTLICINPAISPGAGPAYCNCAVERIICCPMDTWTGRDCPASGAADNWPSTPAGEVWPPPVA
jgi:hypothetical protein